MFTVIYSFQVKPKQDKIFIKAWSDLTKLILEYEGSLGSRLHLESDGKYIAYAQWPSKKNGKILAPIYLKKLRKLAKQCMMLVFRWTPSINLRLLRIF